MYAEYKFEFIIPYIFFQRPILVWKVPSDRARRGAHFSRSHYIPMSLASGRKLTLLVFLSESFEKVYEVEKMM